MFDSPTTASAPLPAGLPRWRRLRSARAVGALVLTLAVGAALGAGTASADPAPQQWLPTAADLVRALRPCVMAVSAPTPPVCWSMTEDSSAWMAQPPGSPYPWGQCTYYAGLMRPDIWNDRAPPSADPLYDDWDAWTWVEHAQAEGLPVDGDPRPGDVMVYSRAAVGNAVGHVALVDAVGAADPATGDLQVTISEMNVDGLDDAALGQGDTMTLLLPRAQLVPGMIQFIHRPAPGYVAPAWPHGAGGADIAAAAIASPAAADPSLSVGLLPNRLETVSESTSPVQATVTAVPGGAVVKRLTVAANRIVPLGLPGGTYRVCVRQGASAGWPVVAGCASAAWTGPAARLSLTAARMRIDGHRLMLSVTVRRRGQAGSPTVGSLIAVLHIVVRRPAPGGGGRKVVSVRRRLRLRLGEQALPLPLAARTLRSGHATLTLEVPAQTRDGVRLAGVQIARTL